MNTVDDEHPSDETPQRAHASCAGPLAKHPVLCAVPRKHGVYTDLSMGVIGVAYEHIFDEHIALHVAAGLYGPWYSWRDSRIVGAGVETRAFLFALQPAPAGLYLSPGMRVAWVRADRDGKTGDGNAWSARLTIGYSLMFVQRIILRIGGGIQYHEVNVSLEGEAQGFSQVFPAADLFLGVAF